MTDFVFRVHPELSQRAMKSFCDWVDQVLGAANDRQANHLLAFESAAKMLASNRLEVDIELNGEQHRMRFDRDDILRPTITWQAHDLIDSLLAKHGYSHLATPAWLRDNELGPAQDTHYWLPLAVFVEAYHVLSVCSADAMADCFGQVEL